MISTLTGGNVMEDVKQMVVDIVDALLMEVGGNSAVWKKKWLIE
jgi:hypothetical protein